MSFLYAINLLPQTKCPVVRNVQLKYCCIFNVETCPKCKKMDQIDKHELKKNYVVKHRYVTSETDFREHGLQIYEIKSQDK